MAPARSRKPAVELPPKPRNNAERRKRLDRIVGHLDALYPDVTCALQHRSAWELLVATILSAQCTDDRVNKVTPGLFAKYPTVADFAAVSQEELAREIRSTGFFNNKAKSLRGAAQTLLRDFGGEVPRTMEQLLTVPGVARKTANVVLGTAFGIASGVVVDTHVQRLARRWDLTRHEDPARIERDLMNVVSQDRWILFSHQVIHHGRRLCLARKPRCADCPMTDVCYSKDRTA